MDSPSDASESSKQAQARVVLRENKQRAEGLQNVHCMLQGKRDAAKRALEETVARHLEGVSEWKAVFTSLIDSEFVHKTELLQNQFLLVRRASAGLQASLDKLDALKYSPIAPEMLPGVAQQLSQYMTKSRQVNPHQLLDFTFQEVPTDRRARSRLALGYLQTASVSPTELTLSLLECDGLRVTLVVKSSRAYDPATVTHLSYSVRDAVGSEVQDVDWKDERDGMYTVTISASDKGQHVVSVYLYNVHVNDSPLRIDVTGQTKNKACNVSVQTTLSETNFTGDDEEYTSWLKEKFDREMSRPSPQTVAELAPGSASATPVRQHVGSGRLKIPIQTKVPVLDLNENYVASLPRLPVDDWSPRQPNESADSSEAVSRVRSEGQKRAAEIRRPTAERLRSALQDLKIESSGAGNAASTSATTSEMKVPLQHAVGTAEGATSISFTDETVVLRRPASLGGSPVSSQPPSGQSLDGRTVELLPGLRITLPQNVDRTSQIRASRSGGEFTAMDAIAEGGPDVMVEEGEGYNDVYEDDIGPGPWRNAAIGSGDGREKRRRKKNTSDPEQQTRNEKSVQSAAKYTPTGSGDAGRSSSSRSKPVIRITSDDLVPKSVDFCSGYLQATLEVLIKPDPIFNRPIGVALDPQTDSIYVGDTSNDCVRCFSFAGEELNHSPIVQLRRPSAVVTLSGDRIAIRYDYGIKIYSTKIGNLLHDVGAGFLRYPFGLAATSSERIVTVDTASRRPTIYVFDAKVQDAEPPLLHSVDITGAVQKRQTAKLRFIAASEMRVAVVDLGNNVVYLLTWAGDLVASVGGGARLSDPAGVALDSKGSLLVADSLNHRIIIFGSDGSPHGVLDVSHKLKRPSGLCVSGDQMMVLNYWENTAHRYKLAAKSAKK